MEKSEKEGIHSFLSAGLPPLTHEAWKLLRPWFEELVSEAVKSFKYDQQTKDDIIIHVATGWDKARLIPVQKLKAWIRRTAYNKAVDIYRARKRRLERAFSDTDVCVNSACDPSEALAYEEELNEYHRLLYSTERRAVAELSPEELRLYRLLHLHQDRPRGYVCKIARELGVERGAADVRIHRLRKKLRAWRKQE